MVRGVGKPAGTLASGWRPGYSDLGQVNVPVRTPNSIAAPSRPLLVSPFRAPL